MDHHRRRRRRRRRHRHRHHHHHYVSFIVITIVLYWLCCFHFSRSTALHVTCPLAQIIMFRFTRQKNM